MKHLVDIFGDHIPAKTFLINVIGSIFVLANIQVEHADMWLGIILKVCGIISFFVAFFISIPKIIELLGKINDAIKTTFKR